MKHIYAVSILIAPGKSDSGLELEWREREREREGGVVVGG